MSTDGTKPPSIAPKKSGARGPRTSSPRTQSGSGARKTSTSAVPSAATNGAPGSTDEDVRRSASAPVTGEAASSVGDRLKRVGQSVAGATRGGTKRPRSDGDPATSPAAAPHAPGGPRRVRLAVSKVDPWSVMKLSFLLSVAVGIMIVVAAAVIWQTLDGQAVFTQVDDTIAEITGDPEFFDVLEYTAFDRVLSLATVIAVVDIVLLTALSTIGAFLYNIVAALVGGIHVTLTDD